MINYECFFGDFKGISKEIDLIDFTNDDKSFKSFASSNIASLYHVMYVYHCSNDGIIEFLLSPIFQTTISLILDFVR